MGGVLYPRILASRQLKIQKLGGKVVIYNNKVGAVQIGFGYVGIVDKKYCRSLWENTGVIEFKGSARLGIGTKIVCKGHLIIGDNFVINAKSSVVCMNKITIADGCLISWDCLLMDSDFHKIYNKDDSLRTSLNQDAEINIGSNVWIGCRTTVLKGTTIPNNAVIGA